MGHTYAKKLFTVYLKFKFHWVFAILLAKSGNSTPASLKPFPFSVFPPLVAPNLLKVLPPENSW